MNTYIERHFAKMGARARLHGELTSARNANGVSIDIRRDNLGEFFDIALDRNDGRNLLVLDVQPRLRHLVLMYRRESADANSKFLCGHDERAWRFPRRRALRQFAAPWRR
jgi:hypothetical protein